MSKIEKAKASGSIKGWKHSKPGLWLSIGTSAFGVLSIVKDVKKARSEQDNLLLANAVVGALALVTGTALLLRELKHLGDDDVLLG
ncbi:hypothetical protein P3T36_002658 [Kitasatospora sp. MAP12-15]|uniref:hypothetical protein n=1 Tax=unclassified Kitasatospora TaxID=2633591 RepID=UPI002472F2C6|nr:hypothetical protein [Kitasatospora sp. MAP12-44]MDH6112941.1 hypothetical protein [Kitasatospora sp. MAP12-44]